jgi:hypothetical protein
MRWSGDADASGRYVLIVKEPGRRWVLARLPRERGRPMELLANQVFTSIAEAEWEVFKRRWEALTGAALPASFEEASA